jgi:hypothetical protein
MPRLHLKRLVAGGVVVAAPAGCGGSLHQSFEFERAEQQIEGGGAISLIARGEWTRIDSAGTVLHRAASPYRIGPYLKRRGVGATHVKSVTFVGMEPRKATSPSVPATS